MTGAISDNGARERAVFFSDAVFAIAMTLLAIDLRLPASEFATNQALLDALLALAPRFAAYALSFFVIAMSWLAHWRRYQTLHAIDERLIALNLLLLAVVAAIPFLTILIGEHGNLPLAVAAYAATVSLTGLLGAASSLYALRAGLVRPDGASRSGAHGTMLRSLVIPSVMLGSLPLLRWLSPYVVEISWFLIVPMQFIVRQFLTKRCSP